MNVSLQTPNHCFEARFNTSAAAKAVMDSMPFDADICVERHSLYFNTKIKVPLEQSTDLVNVDNVK